MLFDKHIFRSTHLQLVNDIVDGMWFEIMKAMHLKSHYSIRLALSPTKIRFNIVSTRVHV